MHILYAEITPEQRKHWKVSKDFEYVEIKEQAHFKGYPTLDEGTFYSVYYVKNATKLK